SWSPGPGRPFPACPVIVASSHGRAPARPRRRPARASSRLLDGLLEARAGREARHPAGGDGHRLAGARIAPLASAALGDVELPESGEVDVLAGLQSALDRAEDSVHGGSGVLLAETARTGDTVDELALRH